MKIKQVFNLGNEEECLEQFLKLVPDDQSMQEAISEVFTVIQNSITYSKLFTIQVDTEAMTAEVVEVA